MNKIKVKIKSTVSSYSLGSKVYHPGDVLDVPKSKFIDYIMEEVKPTPKPKKKPTPKAPTPPEEKKEEEAAAPKTEKPEAK